MIWQSLSPLKHCTLVSSWIPVQPFSVLSCTFVIHFACIMLRFRISVQKLSSHSISVFVLPAALIVMRHCGYVAHICCHFRLFVGLLWWFRWSFDWLSVVYSHLKRSRAMARPLGSFSKASALPAADVLLAVIFLRWFWSRSWLVLLHYPHTACLYWSTPTHRETEHVCSDLPDQLREFVQICLTIKTGNLNRLKKPL